MKYYILDENHQILRASLMQWARFYEDTEKRRIALHELDSIKVSTVFLGIDHNFTKEGRPILFETMSFPDEEQERYCTYQEALWGHYRHCRRVWGEGWQDKFLPTEDIQNANG